MLDAACCLALMAVAVRRAVVKALAMWKTVLLLVITSCLLAHNLVTTVAMAVYVTKLAVQHCIKITRALQLLERCLQDATGLHFL